MQRREFLKLSGLASLPLLAPRLVFSAVGAGGSRDVLVTVFMRGGADGLNIVVPHGEGRYYDLRPGIAVAPPGTDGGALDIDGFFGLHPALSSLAPLLQSGDLAIVHAAGSPHDSRSHFDAQDYMETGNPGAGSVYDGWLNRHLQDLGLPADVTFQAVGLGSSLPLSLQGAAPAIGLNGVDSFGLAVPAGAQGAMRETILGLYGGDAALDAEAGRVFQVIDELRDIGDSNAPSETAGYPAGAFGQQMAALASLIKADVGLEVASVDIGGWDHHDRELEQLPGLLDEFGQGLAAFRSDLGDRMANVTVVTMTEFGRRVQQNASDGTDHGHGSLMFALGGGVNGGAVYGEWPGLGEADLNRGDLEVTTDFRTVLSDALINRRRASDIASIFPDFDGPTGLGLFAPRG